MLAHRRGPLQRAMRTERDDTVTVSQAFPLAPRELIFDSRLDSSEPGPHSPATGRLTEEIPAP